MGLISDFKQMKINKFNNDNCFNSNFSNPENITPHDDSYNSNHNFFNMGWWHFEASFKNGYSFYFGIALFSIKNCGFIICNNKLFHNGMLLTTDRDLFLFPDFDTSFDYPLIKIKDKIFIKFDKKYFDITGKWRYDLLFNGQNSSLNLSFTSIPYGYKTKTRYFYNIITQPKAAVKGLLTVDGEEKQVMGMGYHNRIWKYSPISFLKEMGFFAGSILGNTLSVTWDRSVTDMCSGHTLMRVYDDKNSKAYTIQSEHVTFILNDFIRYKKKQIPTKIFIKSDCIIDKKPLSIDLELKIKDIHQENFFNLHYLIFHIMAQGKITLGSQEESFHRNISLAEYPLFKSQSKQSQKKIYWN